MAVTTAEAIERCMARGIRRADCEASVRDHSVDGVYCDGTIVITEAGKRCVSRELEQRVQDTRDASPLPVSPGEPIDSVPLKSWMQRWAIVAGLGAVALVGLLVIASSKKRG